MRFLQRYAFILCMALTTIVSVSAQTTVSLTSSSGHPGDEVEVSVMLSNAQSATALQINIPHSPYMSYVDGSAVLNKQRVSATHQLSVSDKDNLLSLYVYDISLNPFLEGTEALITFRLQLDKEPGIYDLKPEVVLSDAGGKALSVNAKGGKMTILGPKISLSETEIDYGSVPIRSTHIKKVSVSNTGNETLTVSEIKSGSTLFKVSPTSMTIAAGKQQTLTIEYTPQNAGNELADITFVSNATNSNQTIHVSATPFSVNTLSVADVAGQSGEEVTVSVSMQNMEPIVAAQCRFILPEALKYVEGSAVLSGRATGSHQISGTMKDDQLSFFIHSAENKALSGNEGVLFTFKLLLDGMGGDYPLTPTDVLLSNLAGSDMTSEVKGATVRIAAPRIECATELDFGRMPLEKDIKQRFTIRNSGESPLVIQRVEFTNEAFSLTNATNLPTIAAGGTTEIEVCYHPAGEETFTGVMQIYSNDPQNRMQTVEMSGITYATNEMTLSGEAVSGQPSQYALTISMQNSLPVVALQFNLHWIPGMVPVQETVKLSARATGHEVKITEQAEGNYQILIYSSENKPIAPGEGSILTLIYNNKVEGSDYNGTNIMADQIILSTQDERNCASSTTASLRIGGLSGILGDANNDGKITVTDAACIIDYLLERDFSRFTESQADMNQDQRITITDVVEIIHTILQQ